MNTQNDNHTPTSIDEPFDRLVEIGLMELVGGATPPDLSERITAAAANFSTTQSVFKQPRDASHPMRWFLAAIAATLLVGGTVLLSSLPRLNARFASTTAKNNRVGQASTSESVMRDRVISQEFRGEPAPPVAPTGQLVNESAATLPAIPATAQDLTIPAPAPMVDTKSSTTGGTFSLADAGSKHKDLRQMSAPKEHSLVTAMPIAQPEHYYLDDVQPTPLATSASQGSIGQKVSAVPTNGSGQPIPMLARGQLAHANENYDTLDFYTKSDRPKEIGLRAPMPALQRWQSPQEEQLLSLEISGDQYAPTVENPFIKAEGGDAVSTFGIDVDTASYSNVRQFLLDMHRLPPVNAVRIEELVNYFHYDYAGPKADEKAPFAAHFEVAGCPWNREHRLARIAVKGREMDRNKRPQSNLVFLIDVSGSMNEPAKLPLVTYGLEQLTRELGENDHIAIVVYAGNTGLVLPSTSGAKQDVILAALRKLEAGGSTSGGAGIQLAYQIAEENFIKGGTNRIILCTDGDFNVGTTSTDELQKLVATKAKDTGVFISTLGFGRGNLNDAMMVAISDHGNGNYHYIDNRTEARRVLVEEMTGTLVTIAKDVKIQVEFNPAKVAAYRLIGYEKRMLKTEDFNNDKKDAGEIGAGHTVTALYEIVPAGKTIESTPPADDLKYQKPAAPKAPVAAVTPAVDGASSELLTLKMRYKAPDGDTSQKLEWPVTDGEKSFDAASQDFRFAAAVAGFGMLLRDSQYKGDYVFSDVMKTAENALGRDEHGFRSEFLEMVKEAQRLKEK